MTKLHIPKTMKHHGESFILDSIKRQKREALQVAKEMGKNNIRSRIKFLGNKFAIYGDKNGKKKKEKKYQE